MNVSPMPRWCERANCSSTSAPCVPSLVSRTFDPPFCQSNVYTWGSLPGSMPLITSVPPWLILTSAKPIPVATATPGVAAAVGTVAGGIGCPWLWGVMIRLALTLRSSAPRNVSLNPLTNTATKTTSATPIISAAAVIAVRPGFRMAFSRASRPGPGASCCERPADDLGERADEVLETIAVPHEDEHRAEAEAKDPGTAPASEEKPCTTISDTADQRAARPGRA